MRRSLHGLLDGAKGIQVAAEACELSTTTRYVHGYHPQVLVLDVRLPDGSSPDFISRMREQLPTPAS
jgi:DNA-binding NarL/FixJ family response regulator